MDLLFNEAELTVEAQPAASETENEPEPNDANSKDKHKKKKRGKRKKLPDHLPRERVVLELDDSHKNCPTHQQPMVKIGEEIIEKLQFIPAQVKVLEIVTPIFKAECCENVFIQPERDPDPIPKSFATPSLLAQIVTAKFVDSMPLYRQERFFNRLEIDLDRTTMARWMIQVAELASPLDNLMFEDLIESPVIHMDETTVQVLNEPNRAAECRVGGTPYDGRPSLEPHRAQFGQWAPVSMVGLFLPRREHATNVEFRHYTRCIEGFLDLFPSYVPVSPSPIKPLVNKMPYSIYEPPDTGTAIGYGKIIYPSAHHRSDVLENVHVVRRIAVSPEIGSNLLQALIHAV